MPLIDSPTHRPLQSTTDMASLLNNLVFYFLCGEVLLLLLLLLPMPGSLRRVMLRWVALSRSIGQHGPH